LLAIFIALISPLDNWASLRFSAHMVQHILLMHAAGLLLVLSYPLTPFLLGLPSSVSAWLGRWWSTSPFSLRRTWGLISQPVFVWILYVTTVWGWHIPEPYTAALENDFIHFLEHLSFLLVATLFWWTIVYYFGRKVARRGAGVIYLFTMAIATGALGALLTFSSQPWYPIYAEAAVWLEISAVEDQNLAGLIMWVPEGVIFTSAALILMKTWIDGMDRRGNRSVDDYFAKQKTIRKKQPPPSTDLG
jgi:putative membrane protein